MIAIPADLLERFIHFSSLENRAGCGTQPIWNLLVSPCPKAMIENRIAWPYFAYSTPDILDLEFQNSQKIMLKGTKLLILAGGVVVVGWFVFLKLEK